MPALSDGRMKRGENEVKWGTEGGGRGQIMGGGW